MNWLTMTEISKRAKSKKGALKVSYEHWNQLYQAPAKELREAIKKSMVDVGNEYCGLCKFYDSISSSTNCSRCPLGASDGNCYKTSGNLYAEVRDAFLDLEFNGDWWAWKRAAKALRDKLKELMNE